MQVATTLVYRVKEGLHHGQLLELTLKLCKLCGLWMAVTGALAAEKEEQVAHHMMAIWDILVDLDCHRAMLLDRAEYCTASQSVIMWIDAVTDSYLEYEKLNVKTPKVTCFMAASIVRGLLCVKKELETLLAENAYSEDGARTASAICCFIEKAKENLCVDE